MLDAGLVETQAIHVGPATDRDQQVRAFDALALAVGADQHGDPVTLADDALNLGVLAQDDAFALHALTNHGDGVGIVLAHDAEGFHHRDL